MALMPGSLPISFADTFFIIILPQIDRLPLLRQP